MLVRIRFGRGTSVQRRNRKNARMAMAASTCGTLAAISCGTLGSWRLGQDLGWAGDFVFESGVLSHWQVWLSAAALLQYGSWRLARLGHLREQQAGAAESRTESSATARQVRAAANS
jgi:hypothetical protein